MGARSAQAGSGLFQIADRKGRAARVCRRKCWRVSNARPIARSRESRSCAAIRPIRIPNVTYSLRFCIFRKARWTRWTGLRGLPEMKLVRLASKSGIDPSARSSILKSDGLCAIRQGREFPGGFGACRSHSGPRMAPARCCRMPLCGSPQQPTSIQGMTRFCIERRVRGWDRIGFPAWYRFERPTLRPGVAPPSPEEQRLVQIYRKKGLDAVLIRGAQEILNPGNSLVGRPVDGLTLAERLDHAGRCGWHSKSTIPKSFPCADPGRR